MDLSQFHDTFFEESAEGLDDMENALLNLDTSGDYEEDINTIFRGAHSIKGGAATFGFSRVADFTHIMETLLDKVRSGDRQISRDDIDLFLRSVDCIREMLSVMQHGGDIDEDNVSTVQAQLDSVLKGGVSTTASAGNDDLITEDEFENLLDTLHGKGKGPVTSVANEDITDEEFDALLDQLHGEGRGPTDPGQTASDQAAGNGIVGWNIHFVPEPEMLRTGNDPLRILRELEDIGEVETRVNVDQLPTLDQLVAEDCYLGWHIKVKTGADMDTVREVFAWVEDQCKLLIEPMSGTDKWSGNAVVSREKESVAAARESGSDVEESFMVLMPGFAGIFKQAASGFPELLKTVLGNKGGIAHVQGLVLDAVENLVAKNGNADAVAEQLKRLASALDKSGIDRLTAEQSLKELLKSCAELSGKQWKPQWTQAWNQLLAPGLKLVAEKTEKKHDELPKTIKPAVQDDPSRAAAADKAEAAKRNVNTEASSIRVSIDKVDELINMVGELVITQSMLSQLGEKFEMKHLQAMRDGLAELENNTRQLQESVMRIRMLPISFAFNRFPRMVRDISGKLAKKIDLKMTGEQTELDKTVMEKIGDPLVHLVRNAIDHGIERPADRVAKGKPETGTLHLNAYHQGGNIVIEIKDDGAGLNTEKILSKAREKGVISGDESLSEQDIHNLIFHPGFSTADQVSDLSGRGVGMDVVRKNIRALGGQVEIASKEGHGSTITIRLPLTLAILDGQTVSVGNETYIIPLVSIVESIQAKSDMVSMVAGRGEVFRLRDEYLPILRLYWLFGVENPVTNIDEGLLVVVEGDGVRVGLFVDDLLGQQQVVIKSLETNFRKVEGLSGATILGDGTVSMIVDVPGLIALNRHKKGNPLEDLAARNKSMPKLRFDSNTGVSMGRGNSLGIDARTIRDSFALLADRADELVDRFYEKLLAKQDVAALFVNTDMDEQKNKLAGAIGFVVKNLDNTEVLVAELNNMGVRHKHYGAEARHYGVVTDTLISVMANMAGKNWTSNIESAWRDLLNVASTVMLSAGAGATVGGVNRIGVKEAKQ